MKIWLLFLMCVAGFADEIYANFDVLPKNSSKLVFQTSGVIKQINVDVSSVVKKGDVLVVLDSTDEQIALNAAKNELESAKLSFEFALNTLNKFKKVKNEISKQDFDKVEFEYKIAALQVKKAKIAVQNIQNQIDKKSLKAPFDGIITAKKADIASGVIALNLEVIEMMSYPEVKLVLNIDEKFINSISVGDEFKFKLSNDKSEKMAKISLIYPTIDTKSRKFKAEAYVKDIKVGSYGEGYIRTK